MCLLRWISLWLFIALGIVSAVGGSCILTLHGTAGASIAYSWDGVNWGGNFATLDGTGTWGPQSVNGYDGVYFRCGGGDSWHGPPLPSSGSQEYYLCGTSAPPTTTNSWCVYNINWVNRGVKYSQLGGYWTWPGGSVTEFGLASGPGGATVNRFAIAPGATFSLMYTNSLGTNSGGCPTLTLSDQREGAEDVPVDYGGTKYSSTSGGPSEGGSSGSVTKTPGPIVSNQPTNYLTYTNSLQQKDLFNIADLLDKALSEVENSIHAADLASRQGMTNIGQNISSMNTNLSSKFDLLSTNLTGLGSNIFAMGTNIGGLVTNLSGMGTNLAKMAGIAEGQTNAASLTISNAQVEADALTNGISWGLITGLLAEAHDIERFRGAMPEESLRNSIDDLEGGTLPATTFGVLEPTVGGKKVFTADFKKSLKMEIFDEYVVGFWTWMTIAVEWALLATVMMLYMEELRSVVRDCLTVPQVPDGIKNALLTAGTVAGGPAGYLGAKAVIFTLKAGTVFLICTVIMFAGSILIVAADTLFSGYNVGAMFADLVAGPGSTLKNFIYLVPFPIFQICVICLNYYLAMWTVNGMVSLLMIFFKVRPV